MEAAQINVDIGHGWYASRYASPVRMSLCLVLTYVDPTHVLDTMMFRNELPLYESVPKETIEQCWDALAVYAEEYVQQQELAAYERTTQWV